jgi:hypothetical protein
LYSSEADQDPLDESNWLIPAYATGVEPPEVEDGKSRVFNGDVWSKVEDNRGVVYWDENGDEQEQKGLGPLPEGTSLTAPETPISELAESKRREIEIALETAKSLGLSWTMPDGTVEVVQTRTIDENNLLGLAITARDLKSEGVVSSVQQIRTESNETYNLTPDQVIEITNSAATLKLELLAKSWDLKDKITAAVASGDRAAIADISWD